MNKSGIRCQVSGVRGRARASIALTVIASIVLAFGAVACGAPSKKTIAKLHAGASVVLNVLVANETLPDQLLAEKIITVAQHETVKEFIAEAKVGASVLVNGLNDALNAEKPSLKDLAPVVAQIIANLRGLSSFVNHEMVQKIFAAAEIGLRVLGSYFALQIGKVREHLRELRIAPSDINVCRAIDIAYDKVKFDLLATAYDGNRFDEYAAALP